MTTHDDPLHLHRVDEIDPPDPRRWLALGVLCISLFLAVVDNTIVNVALPSMSRDLGASISDLQWIVDGYALVFSALLLIGGSLGDRFGRKRMLQVGLVLFAAFSVIAGLSDSIAALVLGRALMGGAAALIFPATLAILSELFTDRAERAKAVGIWSSVVGLAVALGPLTGGVLLERFWWGSIFFVNVPVVVIALIAGALLLPESRDAESPRLDWRGFATSAVAVTILVYSIIEAPHVGWTSMRTIIGVGGGVALLGIFVAIEAVQAHPMLDVRVFKNATFSVASFSITVTFFGLFGFIFLVTQYFQFVRGYSTLTAGLATLPFALGVAVISPVSPSLSNRIGARIVVPAGLLIMAVGFVGAAMTKSDSSYWGFVMLSLVAIAFGMGLVVPPSTDTIVSALPRAQAGVGSAINDATREFGGTLGVAIVGSVFASLYAPRLRENLTGIDAEITEAASESLGSALAVADQAPPDLAAVIVRAAEDSFMDGYSRASLLAAAVVTVGAVCAMIFLPTSRESDIMSTTDNNEVSAR